tara:strand:+ start:746 stop:1087 length:342 start_codon:yes stop_codon:yes gene_type:complete
MKVIVKKRQYGSIQWFEFNSFTEMMENTVLRDLAEGDGYDGILDIYTDDPEIAFQKVCKFENHVCYEPSKKIQSKYSLQFGGIEVYPMSELPEEKKERPVNLYIKYIATRNTY